MANIKTFISKKVKHLKWGIGTIEYIGDESITVHFEKTDTGERSVSFQFPKAFKDGFLMVEDAALNGLLRDVIASTVCYYCKNSEKQTKMLSGIRVCPSCEKEHFANCTSCRKPVMKESMIAARVLSDSYRKFPLCADCIKERTFQCRECETFFVRDAFDSISFEASTMCKSCYSRHVSQCHVCNKLFRHSDGETISTYDDELVELCPDCLEAHTFECSECGLARILEDRAVSNKIKASQKICKFCTVECANCGEETARVSRYRHIDKWFCSSCWDKLKKECEICGDEFVTQNADESICCDCVETKAYEERLKNINIAKYPYKEMRYGQLEYINRCKLFTELYFFCETTYTFGIKAEKSKPFKYIVMDFYGKRIVITYLSREVLGKVKHSENVTMTEFRSNRGWLKVYNAIERWEETSTEIIELPMGKMHILNYPVLLRVQTDYDKNYGKEWNGPDDYIEIGNYGDTTEFYIIGFIN